MYSAIFEYPISQDYSFRGFNGKKWNRDKVYMASW